HVREAWMHAEARHGTAMGADPAFAIERSETLQQLTRARQHHRRWLIQPRELARVTRPPIGELEGERREVGIDDLRGRESGDRCLCAFAPGTVADTRLGAAGTTPALLGRGTRDALRF